LSKVGDAQIEFEKQAGNASVDHLESDAMGRAKADLTGDDVEDRFASMEREDQINRLLSELKVRRRLKS
jgi:hypothetical protein